MTLGSLTARQLDLSACYGSNHSSVWPAVLHLALFNGNPTSSGTELSGVGGYARLNVDNNDTSFSAPDGSGNLANAIPLAFLAASGSYSSSFDYWAFMTLSTGGALLDCGPLLQSDLTTPMTVTVDIGDQVVFPVGGLVIHA